MQKANVKFISYVRVSTTGQHQSGLGEAAQRLAVSNYVRSRGGELISEVQETLSGRKGVASRPGLARALAMCKTSGAAMVIGKLDRLARDVRHFLALIDDSGVDIRFADMPDICPGTDEGRMILVSLANFAEFEGRRIGTRTRAALAVAKAKGTKLGVAGAVNLRPTIEARQKSADDFAVRMSPLFTDFNARGLSQRAMVIELNSRKYPAPRGGCWSQPQVQRLLQRLSALDAERAST